MTRVPIRRALISVYDKTGVVELASGLADAGVTIVSTGSTARVIRDAGVPVTAVEDVTGFPEILGGRVKTLHPKIHGGLLGDPADPEHAAQLANLNVASFELLVTNLYPFTRTVASGADRATIVENIDIGGPAMTRAGAKNHANVAVVVDPASYGSVLDAVRAGGFTLEERIALAATAFAHTAAYDVAVANWFAVDAHPADGWPAFAGQAPRLVTTLRYGENPHQRAALYADPVDPTGPGLAGAELLHGKEMSYNNYVDTDAARRAAYDFADPCVAIIKHANPCGIAVADPTAADPIANAYEKANACDPVSAFGGVIATNRPVTVAMAEKVAPVFTEVIAAPDFEDGAVEVLAARKNLRILRCPDYEYVGAEWRRVTGGVLAQMPDQVDQPGDDPAGWTLAAGEPVDADTLADLAFAWRAVRAVKSNAILLASGRATVGVGMGQVNRVDAARLAVARAGDRAAGSVAASDAYFPFPDGLEVLTEAGVRAVAQPGGSMRDQLTIDAATRAGITLYLTGVRHFYH